MSTLTGMYGETKLLRHKVFRLKPNEVNLMNIFEAGIKTKLHCFPQIGITHWNILGLQECRFDPHN